MVPIGLLRHWVQPAGQIRLERTGVHGRLPVVEKGREPSEGRASPCERTVDQLSVIVHPASDAMAAAAAEEAAATIMVAVAERGVAHVMFATGNSQLRFIDRLTSMPEVPWDRTVIFHMDEYVGVGPDDPPGFQRWIRTRIADRVHPAAAHYLDGSVDPHTEAARYAALLADHPLDLCCLGVGENGHLAFNDPPVADFDDPLAVKVVELDHACRAQQVGEGHFPRLGAVPERAITVTIPALLAADHVLATAPEARKAPAIRRALTGPVDTSCPASALRGHPNATMHLDRDSAGDLGWY
jgi:glucosamine-6-phosphate deaminase